MARSRERNVDDLDFDDLTDEEKVRRTHPNWYSDLEATSSQLSEAVSVPVDTEPDTE